MFQCSSASRKFLNFFISTAARRSGWVSVLFSEPKIPQFRSAKGTGKTQWLGFSALQRAENSSISAAVRGGDRVSEFQCSSASRKFLNRRVDDGLRDNRRRFSALQRAENSSIPRFASVIGVMVRVSVLFSEPKIPQCLCSSPGKPRSARFQCSSASRKFLNRLAARWVVRAVAVSVLFSEPKIPQSSASARCRCG